MRKGIILTTGFGMGCLVGALVLSPYLIPLILGPGYEPSIRIMQVFGLMYPFAAFNHAIRGYVLLPLRQDSQILKATVVEAASNLTVLFLLVSNYQGAGVAAARVLGEIVTSAIPLVVVVGAESLD